MWAVVKVTGGGGGGIPWRQRTNRRHKEERYGMPWELIILRKERQFDDSRQPAAK